MQCLSAGQASLQLKTISRKLASLRLPKHQRYSDQPELSSKIHRRYNLWPVIIDYSLGGEVRGKLVTTLSRQETVLRDCIPQIVRRLFSVQHKMTSHILRNTRLYTRQLNEQEMDILAAWLETLDPVNPGEEAAEITVVLHHSLRQNNRANASSGNHKTPPQTSVTFTPPHHPKSHTGSQNGFGNNSTSYAATTRSEGNSSPDWKSNSRQIKSFRPPPIFIPGMPNLPQVKTYSNTESIDERISPEMARMKNYGTTPVTAIRTHCPPSVLSNDMTKNGVQSVSNSSDPPTRQNERLDSRVANWIRNTSSNSSYLGHQSQKNPSKGTSTLPAKLHDPANDPAILALMTAVVEEKKVEEARTSPRLMGSSERVIYASSNSSTSSRDRRVPASSRPRGYPYLKSDLHRDTGRLGMYQSDLPLTYSHI